MLKRALEAVRKMAPKPKNTISAQRTSPGYLPTKAGRNCEKCLDARPAKIVRTNARRYHVRLLKRTFKKVFIHPFASASLTPVRKVADQNHSCPFVSFVVKKWCWVM